MVEVTFLGTGTSNGIPIIGCSCPVCTSCDPRDRRSRTSAVIRFDGRALLIDAAPELRLQSISTGLKHIDAAAFTHAHADHVGGLDDLRRFNQLSQAHLPVYTDPGTAALLRARFSYAFEETFPFYGGKPDLIMHEFDGAFDLFGREVIPIPVAHGRWLVYGFRFGPLVYITDAKEIPASSLELMRGVDVLVLNALRERAHPTHLNLSEALSVIEEVQPRQAYLVHISHELAHEVGDTLLPDNVQIAYDGLTVRTQAAW